MTIARPRLIDKWRESGEDLERKAPFLRASWVLFGPLILFVAGCGHALAVAILPSMVLAIITTVTLQKIPEVAMMVVATLVLLVWALATAMRAVGVMRRLRQGVIDLEEIIAVVMMTGGFFMHGVCFPWGTYPV